MTNQLLRYKSVYVFAGDEEDQREQDDEAGVMDHRLHSLRHLTARHQFHEDEDYPASVKRRKRQQVQQAEVEVYHAEEGDEGPESLAEGVARHRRDTHRSRDVGLYLPGERHPEAAQYLHAHFP